MTPPTLEEWRQWAATANRNWTDDPIGTHTGGRRSLDVAASRVWNVIGAPTRHRAHPRAQHLTQTITLPDIAAQEDPAA